MGSRGDRLVGALAFLLALGALAAPSALANAEEVAYRCDVDICLADPDGFGSVVNLTDNGTQSLDEHPVWSPDGTKIAFVGTNPQNEADRTQNVYVMEPGKGEASNIARQLTFYSGNVYGNDIESLAWSRDGARIVYSRSPNYGAHDGVFVVASDGTTATPVEVAADGYHPSWSPDGGKIAYASYSQQVYTANANGSGGAVPLAGGDKGVEPSWSPDGTQIAFGKVNSNYFVDLNIVAAPGGGASPVIVTLPYPTEYTQWINAAWSPDGGRVSYRSTFENGYGYERVVPRYGGESLGLPKVQHVNMGGGDPPSWSPNGQRLTFDGYSSDTTGREVYVGNADGSGSVTTITTGGKNAEPSWRPEPLVTPYVPIVQPSGGSTSGSGPSGQRPPKLVWFTKRAPILAGAPIHVLLVACGAPSCGASTTGTARYVIPAGTRFRPAAGSKKKPSRIVVGRGKLNLREGETKTLSMYLNKAGKALLRRRGRLNIQATVTIASAGQDTVTSKKTIHLVLAKPAKHKKS